MLSFCVALVMVRLLEQEHTTTIADMAQKKYLIPVLFLTSQR
jgi:hypothetical protein